MNRQRTRPGHPPWIVSVTMLVIPFAVAACAMVSVPPGPAMVNVERDFETAEVPVTSEPLVPAELTSGSLYLPNDLTQSESVGRLERVSVDRPELPIFDGAGTKPVDGAPLEHLPRWTPTPLPSPTPAPLPTPGPTFVADPSGSDLLQPLGIAPNEKWIDISLEKQRLVAYEGRTPVFDSLISSGTALHPTVTGQFRIWLRFRAQDMDGRRLGFNYYLRNVPFVQYFYQDYALHGTYWHSNFGRPMSHGCVNLPTPAAEWLYNWADYGVLVNIHQ
jgi:lipoprotein-anchoring transpeptidase ErfK/SrfK